MDAVFINPSSREQVYQRLGTSLTAIEPPTWAGMLATYCRQRGLAVDILDAEALGLGPEDIAREVQDRAPRLAVVVAYGHQPSASTQTMGAAGQCLRALRDADGPPTLIVGGHVSALPERTLREEACDFVCEGEGPRTVEQLVAALAAGGDDLEQVEGLWYRDADGAIRHTKAAQNLDDLDRDLPGIAWDLLPMERYRAHNWHCCGALEARQPYASLYTSLGCPFKCSFCCINAPFGRAGIRYHSPAQVVGELALLQERYGVRNVKLVDEMFVLHARHVEGICDEILARGLDLNIWAYARIDTVRDGLLPKLARAGFRWLALGIESASEFVRDGAEKKFSTQDIYDTVRRIHVAEALSYRRTVPGRGLAPA